MSQYFDVDVRHVEYGVVRVSANSKEEAIKKVQQATGAYKMKESWISVDMEPLSATPAETPAADEHNRCSRCGYGVCECSD